MALNRVNVCLCLILQPCKKSYFCQIVIGALKGFLNSHSPIKTQQEYSADSLVSMTQGEYRVLLSNVDDESLDLSLFPREPDSY